MIEWMLQLDWSAMGWMVLAAYLGVPRAVDAWDKAWGLPERWRESRRKSAEALVAAELREEALGKLIANSEQILAQVTQYHGSSMLDAVNRIEEKLDSHLAENGPLMERFMEMEKDFRAHIDGHA